MLQVSKQLDLAMTSFWNRDGLNRKEHNKSRSDDCVWNRRISVVPLEKTKKDERRECGVDKPKREDSNVLEHDGPDLQVLSSLGSWSLRPCAAALIREGLWVAK